MRVTYVLGRLNTTRRQETNSPLLEGRCFRRTMHFERARRRCVSDEFLANTKIPVGQFLRNMLSEYVGSGCEVMLRRDSNYSFQLELL